MEKIFKKHTVHIPFNCLFCNSALNLGTELTFCEHVQFIRMKGEFFDYFIYVNNSFGQQYISGLRASDKYTKYLIENKIEEISISEEQDFIAGLYSLSDKIAAAVPYFEDIAVDACYPDSTIFCEERPYGSVFFCMGSEENGLIPGV